VCVLAEGIATKLVELYHDHPKEIEFKKKIACLSEAERNLSELKLNQLTRSYYVQMF
jgi:hypothetical protein